MKNSRCLQIPIVGLVVTGVWLPTSLQNTKWKIMYYAYAILFQFIFFLPMIYVQTVHLFLVLGDIAKTVEVSVLLLTHLAQVAKTANIWLRQHRIKKLLDILDSPVFDRDIPEKKSILEESVMKTFKVSSTLLVSTVVTAGLWGIYPLLKPVLQLPLGYPYIESGSHMFRIWYLQQAAGILLCALGDQTEDLLAGGLMVLATGQLDLLNYELLNIKINQTPTNGNANDKAETNAVYQEVITCIKYHQTIIKYVGELDSIFGTAVLCQFAMSCLIICMTALKITIVTDPTEIITMIFYLMCILAELMVYCYSGDVIKHKSELIARAAYHTRWADMPVATRRLLLLIAVRAQRPLTVTAGNIFELSLKTFTTILRSSYSYFAVLNQKKDI